MIQQDRGLFLRAQAVYTHHMQAEVTSILKQYICLTLGNIKLYQTDVKAEFLFSSNEKKRFKIRTKKQKDERDNRQWK